MAAKTMGTIRAGMWMLPALLAAAAGLSDWRTRRIPNWLTVSGAVIGVAMCSLTRGWAGAKQSLLGLGLGLAILLPFVMIRSLGAGDWKLVGALGAFLGPRNLMAVLYVTLLVAGLMALVLIIWKGRVRQTLSNIGRMLGAFFHLHLPGPELSLDNPEALKIPFGVAVAIAVILFAGGQLWRHVT
jgi:prepilin peptidase CpaA